MTSIKITYTMQEAQSDMFSIFTGWRSHQSEADPKGVLNDADIP